MIFNLIYFSNICLSYIRQTAGATAIVFAMAIPFVLGGAGMAVDISLAYLVKQRLGHALDAAALAAAAASAEDDSLIQPKVEQFFRQNYPSDRLGATYDLQVNSSGSVIAVSASARFNTYFAKFIGIDTIDVSAETIVEREVLGLEVALVLDVTGSMAANNNIGALRTATTNFINIVFDSATFDDYVRVGLVPYSVAVNVGEIAPNIVSALPQYRNEPVVYNHIKNATELTESIEWHGCVEARPYPHDTLDTDISEGGYWEPFWYESTNSDSRDNKWDPDFGGSLNVPFSQGNNRRTPNLACPDYNPIVPLTSDRQKLLESASNITYWSRGGTLGNLGMTWGWRVLSPEAPFEEGAAYDDRLWEKAVIMMTDGVNQIFRKPRINAASDYSAYGRIDEGRLDGATTRAAGRDVADQRFAETCEAMKLKGITVYTVVFGSGPDSDVEEFYRNCASDTSKYFKAPSQDSLRDSFAQIARELSNIHLAN